MLFRRGDWDVSSLELDGDVLCKVEKSKATDPRRTVNVRSEWEVRDSPRLLALLVHVTRSRDGSPTALSKVSQDGL